MLYKIKRVKLQQIDDFKTWVIINMIEGHESCDRSYGIIRIEVDDSLEKKFSSIIGLPIGTPVWWDGEKWHVV